jgi:hypothetical protein
LPLKTLASARFEPTNLGSMASTLTITPPRQIVYSCLWYITKHVNHFHKGEKIQYYKRPMFLHPAKTSLPDYT